MRCHMISLLENVCAVMGEGRFPRNQGNLSSCYRFFVYLSEAWLESKKEGLSCMSRYWTGPRPAVGDELLARVQAEGDQKLLSVLPAKR